VDAMINHHAALAVSLAEQLGLSDAVLEAVGCAYEQWDGQGWPGRRAGADVPLAARLAGLADFVEVAYRIGGVDAARQVARRRRGKQFDPALADVVCDEGEMILSGLDDVGTWDAVIDAEPSLAVAVDAEQFEAALRAVANFVDLKSPYSLGHATAVSDLSGVEAMLDAMGHASRPLILAGGGIRSAQSCDDFRALVDDVRVPVVNSLMGVDLETFSGKPNVGGHADINNLLLLAGTEYLELADRPTIATFTSTRAAVTTASCTKNARLVMAQKSM